MPSHPDRVRRNYTCPNCDGDGKSYEFGGGESTCDECDGAGVVLVPKPRPAPRVFTDGERAFFEVATRDSLRMLKNNLAVAAIVTKRY